MSVVATCSCGRVLTPGDDWVGRSAICPACGARVELPGSDTRSASWAARACLAFGGLAFLLFLVGYADLANRLFPRSISRVVEEARTQYFYLASMVATLIAFATAFLGKRANTLDRRLGMSCACITLMLIIMQAVNFGADGLHSARRAQCVNNLKQIALAMANYESSHGAFPPRVIRDPQGRPLLSWRVAILPFLEQQALYDKFHLDEPWDSPHNLTLIDQIPPCYLCPTQAGWIGKQTFYQAFDGPGTLLDGEKPTRVVDIKDGLAGTLAVVEGPSPMPWTSPRDVPFRPDLPFPAWEATHPGGFNASFGDGSVRFLRKTTTEAELKALATRSGGDE